MTETTQPDPRVEPDRRPHSRACGFRRHAHGPDCHPNCPTCHGGPDAAPATPPGPRPADTRPGLNADHLPFLARLIDIADQADVTVTYCCYNNDWGVMTSPELDDAAGTEFLAALDVGDVGEPQQGASRTIFAGPQFDGGVRLFVRPLPADDDTTEEDA